MKLLTHFLLFCLFSTPLWAEIEPPVGMFKMVNTNGFVETSKGRTPLPADPHAATVAVERIGKDSLNVLINSSEIRLFRLEDGLAALEWNADGTTLLHSADILALFEKSSPQEVPAWGANLDWPGAGAVQLVLLPLGQAAYTGFLISRPGNKTVVRQMEFRQVFGPSTRPNGSRTATAID